MSLEILTQNTREKVPLTPEMIEALEKGYELEMEHLREENIANLAKTDEINSLERKKDIIAQLGDISVGAAEANEELLRKLREGDKLS